MSKAPDALSNNDSKDIVSAHQRYGLFLVDNSGRQWSPGFVDTIFRDSGVADLVEDIEGKKVQPCPHEGQGKRAVSQFNVLYLTGVC